MPACDERGARLPGPAGPAGRRPGLPARPDARTADRQPCCLWCQLLAYGPEKLCTRGVACKLQSDDARTDVGRS